MSKLPFFNPYVEAAFDALETALLEAIRDTSSLAKAGAYAHMWSGVTAAREDGREEMLNALKKEKAPTVGAAGTTTKSGCAKSSVDSIPHSLDKIKPNATIILTEREENAHEKFLRTLKDIFAEPQGWSDADNKF